MKKIKANGFTLVELLAVIVILAIILAIAIPKVTTLTQNASMSSFESDAKLVLKQLEYAKLDDSNLDITTTSIDNIGNYNLSNANYNELIVNIVDEKPYIVIIGKGKWNGLKVCGTLQQMKTVSASDTTTCENVEAPIITEPSYYSETEGVNKPILATGMTPIKWDGSVWIDTTEIDNDWYNYTVTDKKWANAKTADGSMWVWIPRFIYKINTANWHTSTAGSINIQFTKGINDNWNNAVIGAINTDTTSNASNGTWTNHPAFLFGTTELPGIWVAKFEASGATTAIDSKPNVSSLRAIKITDIFTSSRNMETNTRYGWGTTGDNMDTHMTKNIEWGAVAYFTQSLLGKNSEVWINNSSTYTTGCAGSSVSAASFAGCENTYNTTNGVQASTTGNIYGIYDMAGGAWEYIPSYVDNAHNNLSANGISIINADAKYKDVYTMGATDTNANNYALTINKKGDAIYETSASGTGSSAWNGDYSSMPTTGNPWLARRNYYSDGSFCGIFAFNNYYGGSAANIGFRTTLLVGTGL